MHTFFYISTNEMWSGSEELWYRSAEILRTSMHVQMATGYDHPQITRLQHNGVKWFDLRKRYARIPRLKRIASRIFPALARSRDMLEQELVYQNPDLVILSQGNNTGALPFMKLCMALKIPYVTITQLVSEVHWLGITDASTSELKEAYMCARANYFVSKANLRLHSLMIGCALNNAQVVFNPPTVSFTEKPCYPVITDQWHIAAVGRSECFHKGYDILLQVMALEKWKSRPLKLTFYGEGPHNQLLKQFAEQQGLNKVRFAGHTKNISAVWAENHMLILPSRMEGQSLALIEALCCYRGAICTDVGGASELIEEGVSGFIASAPTIESIDHCLERAWQQKHNWQDIGLRAGKMIREKYPADPVAYFNEKLENACG